MRNPKLSVSGVLAPWGPWSSPKELWAFEFLLFLMISMTSGLREVVDFGVGAHGITFPLGANKKNGRASI